MQANTIQLIALAVLLAIAIGLVIFAVNVMQRMVSETERLRKDVLSQLNEISRITRRYQHAEHDLGALLERVKLLASRFDVERFLSLLEVLNRKLQGPKVSPELIALAQEGYDALEQVVETPDSGLAEWRDGRRAELGRLMQQKGRLEAELESMRLRVEESDREISALRARTGELDSVEAALEQLRMVNQRLSSDLKETRRRAQEAEARFNALTLEEQRLRAKAESQLRSGEPMSAEVEAENRNLQNRLKTLENLTDRLRQEAELSKEELSRALCEKTFIEERFLQSVN